MKRNMLLTILGLYFIFIFNMNIKYTNIHSIYSLYYNGLLWVILDNYSIIKYESSDEPIKWINFVIKNK